MEGGMDNTDKRDTEGRSDKRPDADTILSQRPAGDLSARHKLTHVKSTEDEGLRSAPLNRMNKLTGKHKNKLCPNLNFTPLDQMRCRLSAWLFSVHSALSAVEETLMMADKTLTFS